MMILVQMIMMMTIKMHADNKIDENRTSPKKILNPIVHREAKLFGVLGAFLSAIRLVETNDLIFHLVYPQSHLS